MQSLITVKYFTPVLGPVWRERDFVKGIKTSVDGGSILPVSRQNAEAPESRTTGMFKY